MITIDDLTSEQKDALDKLVDFSQSTRKFMVLEGCAGSGKTTLVNIYVELLSSSYIDVICTAPTNEAVRVLSEKSGIIYDKTIYGLMGLVVKEVDDNTVILERRGRSYLNDYDLIIIDEASMINDELYERIKKETAKSRCKILYVGDSYQLPPVNTSRNSLAFSIKNKIFLTEVKRLTDMNPILNTVTHIRKNITSPVDTFSRDTVFNRELGTGIIFTDIKDVFLMDLISHFKSDKYQKDDRFVRALAYTNEEVDYINSLIRPQLFNPDTLVEYEIGERLIVDKPILDEHGEQVVYDTSERVKVLRSKHIKAKNMDFNCWRLEVINDSNLKYSFTTVSRDSLHTYRSILSSLANKCKEDRISGVSNPWYPYFKFKSQFGWVKYSYCSTVHKAQGSTFENVFVNEKDINRLTWDNTERNKLKYVAFTRPSHKLVVYK